MSKSPLIFCEHILENIKDIEEFALELDRQSLERDRLRQKAILRSLEVIGEAVKNLSSQFREKYPVLPWERIAGLRDKLIHHYFGVDLDLVWEVVIEDLPLLKKEIKRIIAAERP